MKYEIAFKLIQVPNVFMIFTNKVYSYIIIHIVKFIKLKISQNKNKSNFNSLSYFV